MQNYAGMSVGMPRYNKSESHLEGIEVWDEYKKTLMEERIRNNAVRAVEWEAANGVQWIRTHADVQIVAFPRGEDLMRKAADMGAYSSLSIDILENAVVFSCGPYYVPNVFIRGEVWYTNNVTSGAMRGFGAPQVVACGVKNIGFGHGAEESSGARLVLSRDGRLTVFASIHEYGQGARAALTAFASRALDIDPEMIEISPVDSGATPPTGPTTASRQTFLIGNALLKAADSFKQKLFIRAAESMDMPDGTFRIDGSGIMETESGRRKDLPFRQPRQFSMRYITRSVIGQRICRSIEKNYYFQ